jgi:hypothetical protein
VAKLDGARVRRALRNVPPGRSRDWLFRLLTRGDWEWEPFQPQQAGARKEPVKAQRVGKKSALRCSRRAPQQPRVGETGVERS